MNVGREEFIFLWLIENYSYCWQENGEDLFSPFFTFDGLDGTSWNLLLYPRGRDNANKVKYELSLLAADGSALHSRHSEREFGKRDCSGFEQFLQKDDIHVRRKAEYLPNDTLSVRCKIWKGEGDIQSSRQISARSRIITEQISFHHIVENFSKLQPNVRNTIKIQSQFEKESVISSSLYYTDGSCCKEKLMMEIIVPFHAPLKCKCFWSDECNEYMRECAGIDNGYEAAGIKIHKLPLSLTRELVLNSMNLFQADKFSLLCQCTFSTKRIIEEKDDECNHTYNNVELSGYPSPLEDLKAIYINQRFSDVQLKTKSKSFPAHKSVLCARSPVFAAMMSSDMKEKISACIEVDDLENDTVQQLLLFLYSDNLENLQWKSATQLFYAADKYQIGKLKAMCSLFLVENLNTSNASDLLLLGDTHNDSSLVKVVQDFILKHEDEVYRSIGWKKLKETNPQLVIKTMCLKYEEKLK